MQGGVWAAAAKKIVLKSLQSLLIEGPCSQQAHLTQLLGLLTEFLLTPTYCMTASITNAKWFTELKTLGSTVYPAFIIPSYFIHFG